MIFVRISYSKNIGHLSKSDGDQLRQNMKAIWTTYFLPADYDNDLSVTVEELVVYMRCVSNKWKHFFWF